MKKTTLLMLLITLFLSGCADINNTPIDDTEDTEPEYTYTGVSNFNGEIVSITGNRIELEDGSIIIISKDMIVSSNYVQFVVTEGPSEFEYYIEEITFQGSLLINPGSDILEVNLTNGSAEVSGNVNIAGNNILQILDKRFIITEETSFNTSLDEGDPLVDSMMSQFSVGDIVVGYGLSNDNNEIISGTISTMMMK